MSLPVVIVFEYHWDTIPKTLIKELLPDLNKRGYGTYCFETPQDLSADEIIRLQNEQLNLDLDIQKQAEQLLKQRGITKKLSDISFSNLAELLRLYVSSQRYIDVAEKIKQLDACQILKQIFSEAAKLSVSIKGVDRNYEDFSEIHSVDLSRRMPVIRAQEDQRITTFFQNLQKLRTNSEEGVIFSCGAHHAKGLIDAFKKHGLQEEVLYYFPHSSSRYDESLDHIQLALDDSSGTLVGHTHLLAQEDLKPFGERVIREIAEKTRYTREIPGYNSHSRFLSNCFKTNFRAYLRPGYHVDALVDLTETSNIGEIQQRVSAAGIQTHQISLDRRNYLAIPNVNTRDIAEKIRRS